MDKCKFYKYPAAYAREHDELKLYRESFKRSIACKAAIEAAITDNWDGMELAEDTAKPILEEFGAERTLYVVAKSIQELDLPGRFNTSTVSWAKRHGTIKDWDSWGDDRGLQLVVSSHPVKLEAFASLARRDADAAQTKHKGKVI